MRVFYLCPSQFAISNIALKRIKIARISDLNDPFELLAIDRADTKLRIGFRKLKNDLNNNTGLVCFAKKWSNPLMWGHYAEKHTGICLGFDVPDNLLQPVIYARTPRKISIEESTGKQKFSDDDIGRLMRTKFYDWKYENEFRMFINLKNLQIESGMYFYSFNSQLLLREVILGPRCEIPIDRVRAMVKPFSPSVSVIKSRIANSSFRVIKSMKASAVG